MVLVDSSIESGSGYQDENKIQDAPIPLHSINAVSAHIPAIHSAREKVTNEMESMVLSGLSSLVSHFIIGTLFEQLYISYFYL